MSFNTNHATMVLRIFEHGCFVETCNHTIPLTYLNGPATRSNNNVVMDTDHRLIWPIWRNLILRATFSFGWSCMQMTISSSRFFSGVRPHLDMSDVSVRIGAQLSYTDRRSYSRRTILVFDLLATNRMSLLIASQLVPGSVRHIDYFEYRMSSSAQFCLLANTISCSTYGP